MRRSLELWQIETVLKSIAWAGVLQVLQTREHRAKAHVPSYVARSKWLRIR